MDVSIDIRRLEFANDQSCISMDLANMSKN